MAAINDVSGFGRCSLTVISPVLSAMGVQVCPVPTAILSSHSGGFSGFSFHDFTQYMDEYIAHWRKLDLEFDCIYSGFLGSADQIDIVDRFITSFTSGKKTKVVVDPVMGDDGVLYSTYTQVMQSKIKELVRKADIITPNLTEACFLLDMEYTNVPIKDDTMKDILSRLCDLGPSTCVITGVKVKDGRFANIAYNREQNSFWKVECDYVPAKYPGTGDIFASVFTGAILNGDNLPIAMDRATQFVSLAIRVTYGYGTPHREGVLFEKVISWLHSGLLQSTYQIIN